MSESSSSSQYSYPQSSGSGVDQDVERAARSMSDTTERYRDQMENTARGMRSYIEDSVRTQPMMTLAVVSAIGFVLGALWKR